jgi:hypothetical protein
MSQLICSTTRFQSGSATIILRIEGFKTSGPTIPPAADTVFQQRWPANRPFLGAKDFLRSTAPHQGGTSEAAFFTIDDVLGKLLFHVYFPNQWTNDSRV